MADIKQREAPTLTKVIETIIERNLVDMHTAIPGIIQEYDPKTKTAKVRPALRRRFNDERGDQELNVFSQVPVGFLQTNDFILSVPLQKGDEVLLIISERSIDSWLENGGIVTPNETRKFDLADAIAIPMLKPSGTGPAADAVNSLMAHGDSSIRMSKEGRMAIGNKAEELISLLQELTNACEAILINTQLGPQAPINKATFTALSQRIGGLIL